MVSNLLIQTCSIVRGSGGTARHGVPGSPTWAAIAENVPVRLDFVFTRRSRLEQSPEENVPRNHGTAFFKVGAGIRARDIIVIDDDVIDEQYDVEFVDAVLDGGGYHHLECSVSRRDNKTEFTPLDP